MSRFIAFLSLFIAHFGVCAQTQQNYLFRHLGQEEGLGDQSISSIVQDERGFIWVGTNAGISLFDGVRFTNYPLPTDSVSQYLCNEDVYCMVSSPDSMLWACTTYGLASIDTRSGQVSIVRIEGMQDKPYCTRMLFDAKGRLWAVGDNEGISCIDLSNRKARHYAEGHFSDMCLTRSGQLWAAHIDGSMYLYNGARNRFDRYDAIAELRKTNDFHIHSVLESEDGHLLLFTNRMGVHQFSPVTHQCNLLFNTDEQGGDLFIHCATMTDGRTMWLGTENGALIYKLGEGFVAHLQKSSIMRNSLSDNAVHHLLCDKDGNIWVGTFFGGLNQAVLYDTNFEPHVAFDSNQHVAANVMRCMVADGEGHTWVGTEDGGLFLLDSESRELIPSPLQWKGKSLSTNIQGMCYVGEGELWVGTFDAGIYVVDTKAMKVTDHLWTGDGQSGMTQDAIVCIKRTSQGEVWIGLVNGLQRYDAEQQRFVTQPGMEWQGIHDILETESGRLWIATIGQGLLTVKKVDGEWKAFSSYFPYDALTCLFPTDHGTLLVGTKGRGLYEYNPATKETQPVHLNMPDEDKSSICSIIEDMQGRLWISTFNGLVCYYPQQGHSVYYGHRNILSDTHFNLFSALRQPDGTLWMGTYNGLISFHPECFMPQQGAPKVYILRGNVDKNSASIHFASPNYSLSTAVWYRYRLKGSSSEWTLCQEPQTLEYTRLAPGNYTLEVQASYSPDLWEAPSATYTFSIAPPWWQTSWAYIIYILLLFVVGALVFRVWWRRHQRKITDAMTRLEGEKYRDILQAKISFFTAITHEIRTPLTLIMAGVERIQRHLGPDDKDVSTLSHNSQRLLNLVNQLLDFRRIESQQMLMSFVQQDMTAIVRQICDDFQPLVSSRHLRFTLNVPQTPVVVLADQEALTKMITNQIGNALKFGQSEVRVDMEQTRVSDDYVVRLRVQNDGPRIPDNRIEDIFKPFEQYHDTASTATIKGSGLGLPLTRSLAQMHGGNYYFDTTEKNYNVFVLELKTMSVSSRSAVASEDDVASEGDVPADLDESTETSIGKTEQEHPTLLLVDDENDLRRFVADELQEYYNVLQAENGRQALEMLAQHNVSLVITDIMMPIVDGVSLCRHIKQSERTSHIPVLMLTAKVSMQDHIDALNSNADAYIEKPFATAHLLAQIGNLLHNRQLVRQRFTTSPYATVSDISTNDTERQFMQKLDAFILENLCNETFNVDTLASHMAMSKSTLYRKMKATTSLSPLDYVRLSRLKEAARLLAERQMSIKAVSEKLNFSSPSYFTSCFMKQFGLTPGEFVKQSQKQS